VIARSRGSSAEGNVAGGSKGSRIKVGLITDCNIAGDKRVDQVGLASDAVAFITLVGLLSQQPIPLIRKNMSALNHVSVELSISTPYFLIGTKDLLVAII
jgi:hypothetical protein